MAVQVLAGETIGRRYIIKGRLGRGGMADVYQAFDPKLDLDVALKILPRHLAKDPTFIARFRREGRTLARLNHPSILRLYEIGEDADAGLYFLVLEYLSNGNLKPHLKGRRWQVADAVELLRPVADALDYAHGCQPPVVHRDLKPANIMFGEHDRVVVCDFGLARILSPDGADAQPSSTDLSFHTFSMGQVLGTPAYMAPEQASGRPSGPEADRYALGVITYEMLTGIVPFHADTPQATLIQVATQALPLPSHINPAIDPGVEHVLLKMLAKEPGLRFETSGGFVDALAEAAQVTRTVVRPAVASGAHTNQVADSAHPPVAAVPGRRRRLVPLVVLGVALGLVAGVELAAPAARPNFEILSRSQSDSPVPTLERAPTPPVAATAGSDITPLPTFAPTVAPTVVRTVAPTATAKPTSTPTTDVLWQDTLRRLDTMWGSDWDGVIQQLDGFLTRSPGFSPAVDKLYAALVFSAKASLDEGKAEEGVAKLLRAQALQPDRGEAAEALLVLTPTPTPVPPAPVILTRPPATSQSSRPTQPVQSNPLPQPTPEKPAFTPPENRVSGPQPKPTFSPPVTTP